MSLSPCAGGLTPLGGKKRPNELPSTFNARGETVATKPMFRGAFKYRRCVIPASGFYEWTGHPGAKTPHYFSLSSGAPLAFAAVWEHWRGFGGGDDIPNTTIIVGQANEWMARLHSCMPVILDWRNAKAWVHGDDPEALLRPPPNDALQEWIVPTRVNRSGVGDDDPRLIQPSTTGASIKPAYKRSNR